MFLNRKYFQFQRVSGIQEEQSVRSQIINLFTRNIDNYENFKYIKF